MKRYSFLRFLPSILILFLLVPSSQAEETLLFEKAIQPIFASKCGSCHSEQVRKGDLDLSSMAAIHKGGESGEALLHAEIDESYLWAMIDGGGMPPENEPQLTTDELATIKQWLQAGSPTHESLEVAKKKLNQHDIIPMMLLRCTACHGSQLQQGGVDLRTAEAMFKGGKNGPALVPGDPDASLMVQRIETEACPPSHLLLKFFVKRPTTTEIQTLRELIAEGAPVEEVIPDVAGTQPDLLVTDKDRQHWAFQPPEKVTGKNTIDEFVLEKLQTHGLKFSPAADRNTLIRRAYLDLHGMPPSPQEWTYWKHHSDPEWYAQMIDQLLESPRYGERWGRYWLDVAGYADSEGGISEDPLRKVAWKYRDYVMKSFNIDKPYDQFLLEQIAGDELIDVEKADVVTEQMVDNLVATGFLRMGIDQTGSRTMNFVPERLGVVSDAISVVSAGVMGLTMECARCHTHKYDPIPHRDYYRFKAIFQGALDEYDWLSFKTRTLKVGTPEQHEQVAAVNPPLEKKLKKLNLALKKAINAEYVTTLQLHYPELTEQDHKDALVALATAENTRTLRQKILVEQLMHAQLVSEDQQPAGVLEARQAIKDLEHQIATVERQMAPVLEVRALWDRGDPSPTYILRRGEYDKAGTLVGPGVPSMLTDGKTPFVVEPPFPGGTPKTGRRLAYAHWLVQPENPLTARVMVNRLWYHHFGRGIVASLDNFGVKGEPPTHPELLDWLAVEFREQGWSIKQMHRLIMNSQVYRQSSRITDELVEIDPQNELLSRMPLRRMDAEAVRDSLLFVAGKLDTRAGGPPDAVSVDREGLVSIVPSPENKWRRSVYLQYRRTQIPTMLDTFDYPEMGPNCLMRSTSTVSPQSLMLKNNSHVRELSAALAARILEEQPDAAAEKLVPAVFIHALSREPSPEELSLSVKTIQQLETAWQQDRGKALESFCHTIFNSAAFLYID